MLVGNTDKFSKNRRIIMSAIYKSADELIGKTPLLELTHIEEKLSLKAKIIA